MTINFCNPALSSLLLIGAFTAPMATAQSSTDAAVPMNTETGTTYKDGERTIILYDAETIARLNGSDVADVKVETASTQKIETATTTSKPVTSDAVANLSGTVAIVTPKSETKPSPYPRDISDQYDDVISGIPHIYNPTNCNKGELDIDITVTDIEKNKGSIVADLHNDVKEDFLKSEKVVLRVRQDVQEGRVSFCMPITQPGDYAVAIYHDKNNNSKFDKNFLGIPKEHFGMSQNPKFGLSSPKYEQAVFTATEDGANLTIKLFSSGDIMGGSKK